MTKKRNVVQDAQHAVDAAIDQVVEQGGVVHEDALFDAAEAALDGRPKQFLADIISGKAEGPYRPTSGWKVGR